MGRQKESPNKYGISGKRREQLDAIFRIDHTVTPQLNLKRWGETSLKLEVEIVCTNQQAIEFKTREKYIILGDRTDDNLQILFAGIHDQTMQPDSLDLIFSFMEYLHTKGGIIFLTNLHECMRLSKHIIMKLESNKPVWEVFLCPEGKRRITIPPPNISFQNQEIQSNWIRIFQSRNEAYLTIWQKLLFELDSLHKTMSLGQEKIGLFQAANGKPAKRNLLEFFMRGEGEYFEVVPGCNKEQAYKNLCILFGLGPNTYQVFKSENK